MFLKCVSSCTRGATHDTPYAWPYGARRPRRHTRQTRARSAVRPVAGTNTSDLVARVFATSTSVFVCCVVCIMHPDRSAIRGWAGRTRRLITGCSEGAVIASAHAGTAASHNRTECHVPHPQLPLPPGRDACSSDSLLIESQFPKRVSAHRTSGSTRACTPSQHMRHDGIRRTPRQHGACTWHMHMRMHGHGHGSRAPSLSASRVGPFSSFEVGYL